MKRIELVRSGLLATMLASLAVATPREDALTTLDGPVNAHVERVG